MRDSQQPKPAQQTFEVPDLELVARAPSRGRTAPEAKTPIRDYPGPNLLENDAFLTGNSTFDLGVSEPHAGGAAAGHRSFDADGALELEGNAYSGLAIAGDAAARAIPQAKNRVLADGTEWPTGRAADRSQVAIDSLELSLFANYGNPPKNVYLTPAYAYRVFQRQRELKRALGSLNTEREQADVERDRTLAEFAHAVRSEAERIEQFRPFFAPLVELERVASQRGQALSIVNAELAAHAAALDTELAAIAAQLATEQGHERNAQRQYEEREETAKRAEAKWKRVHIEIRALVQVAQDQLGPHAGGLPEPDGAQLAALKLRAQALEPEVKRSKADLKQAKVELEQATDRLAAARRSERHANRKKRALVEHYQEELDARGRGLSGSEQEQRAAFADLGRAVLAERGSVAVTAPWLERIQGVSRRADALLLQCEMHLRALDAYDRARVAQGVRLACTGAALFVFLIILKLAL